LCSEDKQKYYEFEEFEDMRMSMKELTFLAELLVNCLVDKDLINNSKNRLKRTFFLAVYLTNN